MLSNQKRCRYSLLLVILLVLSGPALFGKGPQSQTSKRPVEVLDSITMRRATESHYLAEDSMRSIGVFSPDGKRFVCILRKGNVEENANEYSILLFSTHDLASRPEPETLLTMASTSNREAIKEVRWLADNKTLAFLGENKNALPQVYALNVDTKRLEKLTDHATAINAFDITANGDGIVFEADPQARTASTPEQIRHEGIIVSTHRLADLLAGDSRDRRPNFVESEELFLQTGEHLETRVRVDDLIIRTVPLFLSFSPDGRYAVVQVCVRRVPASWSEYRSPAIRQLVTEKRNKEEASSLLRNMLLDVKTGSFSPLVDVPVTWRNRSFAWAPDGRSIVVSGTALPLDIPDASERDSRRDKTYVIEVKIPSRETVKITDKDLKVTKWEHDRNAIFLTSDFGGRKLAPMSFQREGSFWKEAAVETASSGVSGKLEVTLEEDMNTPPGIYLSEPNEKTKVLLLDLNPQFSQLAFATVEAVSWKASDGHEVVGGLYLPPDYQVGTKYPLVVQTHGFTPDRFWIDGPWTSAFAAQPLASKGIIVLQVGGSKNHDDDEYINTPREAPRIMAAYEGAIDYLDARGLIDRDHVGIIGFSRSVYTVGYTLTHSTYHFAAATLADGFDGSYFQYLLEPHGNNLLVNGGPPFGATLGKWILNSPGFGLDRVRAAVRVEAYGPVSLTGEWAWFSGLSSLNKPVEFLYLPYATHVLVKPWERLSSQQGNVRWFSFWLKGEEDSDPALRDTYEHLHELRALQSRNEGNATRTP